MQLRQSLPERREDSGPVKLQRAGEPLRIVLPPPGEKFAQLRRVFRSGRPEDWLSVPFVQKGGHSLVFKKRNPPLVGLHPGLPCGFVGDARAASDQNEPGKTAGVAESEVEKDSGPHGVADADEGRPDTGEQCRRHLWQGEVFRPGVRATSVARQIRTLPLPAEVTGQDRKIGTAPRETVESEETHA